MTEKNLLLNFCETDELVKHRLKKKLKENQQRTTMDQKSQNTGSYISHDAVDMTLLFILRSIKFQRLNFLTSNLKVVVKYG